MVMRMMLMTTMMMETSPSPLLQQPGNKRTTPLVIYLTVTINKKSITINKKHNQTPITLFSSLRALELLPRNDSVHTLALWFLAFF